MKNSSVRLALWMALAVVLSPDLAAQQPQPTPDRPPGQDRPPTTQRPEAPRHERLRIHGRLMLPLGERNVPPLTTVTLTSFAGGFQQTEMVNPEGLFEFRNLPAIGRGRYKLIVKSPGHETTETDVDIDPSFGGGNQYVHANLGRRLEEEGDRVPEPGRETVAALTLSIPRKAWNELEKAEKESARNRPERAIQHLLRALEIHSEFPHAYNNLAAQYVRLNRLDEAVEALDKAIELNPHEALSYFNLGIIHYQREEFHPAQQAFRRALELDPSHPRAGLFLAEAYLRLGQYQLALGFFQQAARRNPEEGSAQLGIGQCHLQLGQRDEALKAFDTFLALEPEGPRAESVRRLVQQVR